MKIIQTNEDGTQPIIELNQAEVECLKFLVADAVKFHKQLFDDIQDLDLLKEIGANQTQIMLKNNSKLFEKLKSIGFDVEKFE